MGGIEGRIVKGLERGLVRGERGFHNGGRAHLFDPFESSTLLVQLGGTISGVCVSFVFKGMGG